MFERKALSEFALGNFGMLLPQGARGYRLGHCPDARVQASATSSWTEPPARRAVTRPRPGRYGLCHLLHRTRHCRLNLLILLPREQDFGYQTLAPVEPRQSHLAAEPS